MKIIAGWIVALAMISGTGTVTSVKPELILADEQCLGLSCWPNDLGTQYRPAHLTSTSQSGLIGQGELFEASGVDRSRKADQITTVAPVTRATLPLECEPPFSPLAKVLPADFIARCFS